MELDDPETIALRATVIASKRYDDDHTVIWREMSIGRIMKAGGVPAHLAQWSWSCSVHGKPGAPTIRFLVMRAPQFYQSFRSRGSVSDNLPRA
jgi:hypothetical protein